MTDDEKRAMLLDEIDAVAGPGLRSMYAQCTTGYLEASLVLLREGKAAIAADGALQARWDDEKLEPALP